MRIRIIRSSENNQSTTGEVHIDNKFICHSLELPWQNNQSYISSIPIGIYSAKVRYDKPDGWRIQFENVPGRTGVQIHMGNYPSQIEGCVLTGQKVINNESRLEQSSQAYTALRNAFYGTDTPTSTPNIELSIEISYMPSRTSFTSATDKAKYVYQRQAYWEEILPNQSPNPIQELYRDLTHIHLKYSTHPILLKIPLFGGKTESKWGAGTWEVSSHIHKREN